MPIFDQIELQRMRYWQGQLIRSRDFRDQDQMQAQLHWWHNRAMHNTYGVCFGLKSEPVTENEVLIAVRLKPGMAYDCFGREIILQDEKDIPIPTLNTDNEKKMTLLIRYKETAQFPYKDNIPLPNKSQLFYEQPGFVWKPSEKVSLGDGVPIARIFYDLKSTIFDSDFSIPLNRPLARPRIAGGNTIIGNTAWELWTDDSSGNSNPSFIRASAYALGRSSGIMQVKIDTSSAGYTIEPCYFASIGFTLSTLEDLSTSEDITTLKAWFMLISSISFTSITDITLKSFTFRMFLPFFTGELLSFMRQHVFVSWLGIEPTI